MGGWGYLFIGLLAGWAAEFAFDFFFWRRKAQRDSARLNRLEDDLEEQAENQAARERDLQNREADVSRLAAAMGARESEVGAQMRRVDERCEALDRLERAGEDRKSDLDRQAVLLTERDRSIQTRQQEIRRLEQDLAERQSRMAASEADLARRLSAVTNRESSTMSWEDRLNQREQDLAEREQDVRLHTESFRRLRDDHAGLMEILDRRVRGAQGEDNLSEILGIHDAVAEHLHQCGIDTFQRLAETSQGELTRMMEFAQGDVAVANPMTWPEQAALLVERNYVAFERMRQRLQEQSAEDARLLTEVARNAAVQQPPMVSKAPVSGAIEGGVRGSPALSLVRGSELGLHAEPAEQGAPEDSTSRVEDAEYASAGLDADGIAAAGVARQRKREAVEQGEGL